jgi:N-acetylglucosaminyldiphosphoundecaprenol N-acetyl-beta-D-mannosaminyltransferase
MDGRRTIGNERETRQISFLNADCANRAWQSGEYRSALASSALVLADGIGMKLAGRILQRPVRQNVNGTDLFPRLCETLDRAGGSLYLLGARPGVPELVVEWIREHSPNIRIAGFRHGYFQPEEEAAVIGEIARSNADVLLVAFGAPSPGLVDCASSDSAERQSRDGRRRTLRLLLRAHPARSRLDA